MNQKLFNRLGALVLVAVMLLSMMSGPLSVLASAEEVPFGVAFDGAYAKAGEPMTVTVSGASGSDLIFYDAFEYDDGVFYGELTDLIDPTNTSSYAYGRLMVKVNTDDADATVYITSDGDSVSGGDNETLYIEISEDEYDDDRVILHITVEDSDGYETEYELTVWLEY